ncbi:MAG: alpha/beta hydrolase [Betaproteobacteria bacterium]|nr:MAG: alpha/beta hydrolase [Betaproteobacteria bacterium]
MHLTADGRRLEYRIIEPDKKNAQQRTMLVLLHEGLGSVSTWRDFPHVLATQTGHPVLVYSRYGHGRSSELEEPRPPYYMHHEALTVLPEVFAELGIQEPFLIGHSDGASIAILYAGGGHPVKGLVLMAPHVFVEDLTIDSIAAARDRFEKGGLSKRLARYHDHPETMFRGWSDIWLSPEFRAWNIEANVKACNAPILLIQGRNDPYGTLAQIDSIERHASSPVDKLLFSDCGHTPHVERSTGTLAAIEDFVKRVDSAKLR